MNIRPISYFLGIGLCLLSFFSRDASAQGKRDYDILRYSAWADSIIANMTLDEKIGQLFVVSAYSTGKDYNLTELKELVKYYHIGGLIFFKGEPYKQAVMTNTLQKLSKVPLMVSIDAEWGLAMRLDSTPNFGYMMPHGAISDDSLTYKMAEAIAKQCRRLGIHVNYAPVADINTNPLNPVINLRSFGENKKLVARKAIYYLQGLQDNKVLAVAKHFPGHGNTHLDSHHDLPTLSQSRRQLNSVELFPFKALFRSGVGGLMTAHLQIPSFDTLPKHPASISPSITTSLLRFKLDYNGLVFTDGLNMKGVSKYYKSGQLEIKALVAGNDILLCSERVPLAISAIKDAVLEGCLSESFIDEKLRRILRTKAWLGLDSFQPIELKNLNADLNAPEYAALQREIAQKSVTLMQPSSKGLVPLTHLDTLKIANLVVGAKEDQPFQQALKLYTKFDQIVLPRYPNATSVQKMVDSLKAYNLIVISLHSLSNNPGKNFGLSATTIEALKEINRQRKTVLVSFGSPYALASFTEFKNVIEAYQDEPIFQEAAAQVLMGGTATKGKLPVTAAKPFSVGSGIVSDKTTRIATALPMEVGLDEKMLDKIEPLVHRAIKENALPGCQIAIIRNNKLVYNKSFGSVMQGGNDLVTNDHVYDLASITKVASTTLCVMKLQELGILDINEKLSTYLPELVGTNKANITLKELLTHEAGLPSFSPFYQRTLTADKQPSPEIYCEFPNDRFSIPVSSCLYMDDYYIDSISKWMDQSAIKNRGKYLYSDFSFLYLQRVLQKVTGKPLNKLADSILYNPLGLPTLGYLPTQRNDISLIVPTANDNYFRRTMVRGTVHDPTSAMLGGVAGHAGLFSNASDLATLMNMLLNNGVYGGRAYFKPATIELFTSKQATNSRRGLGWDRQAEDPTKGSPMGALASTSTFGHSGFTGTCVWVDPVENIVFVFLSNRTLISEDNNMLAKLNTRTDIHDLIYKAIIRK